MRPTPLLAAGLLAAGSLAAVAVEALPATAASHGATVTLKDIAFHKASVTIHKGQSVTWVWKDGDTTHNVTSEGTRRFKTGSNRNKGSYKVKFTKAGTYKYECTLHPGMVGKVIVK